MGGRASKGQRWEKVRNVLENRKFLEETAGVKPSCREGDKPDGKGWSQVFEPLHAPLTPSGRPLGTHDKQSRIKARHLVRPSAGMQRTPPSRLVCSSPR